MGPSSVEQIETDIAQLSLSDQLWLMERLAYRIRHANLHTVAVNEDALVAMAADPAIQHELQQIHAEFALTEMDGLDSER
jgi:hypothetical protein